MSVELLREAARLMRERAEAATYTSMPWDVDETGAVWAQEADGQPVLIASRATEANAEHIASFHPAVALAVADWLEYVADQGDRTAINHRARALAVARAYSHDFVAVDDKGDVTGPADECLRCGKPTPEKAERDAIQRDNDERCGFVGSKPRPDSPEGVAQ